MKSYKGQKAWNLIKKSRSGPKSMKSRKKITLQKAWTLIRKWKLCSLKHEISEGNLIAAQKKHENPDWKSCTKNVQHKAWSPIRVKARKGGWVHSQLTQEKRTEEPWSKYRGWQRRHTANFMHDQLLSPLLIIFPSTPSPSPPCSRTQPSCNLCITSSPPTSIPDYFETTVFGTRAFASYPRYQHKPRLKLPITIACSRHVVKWHLIFRILQHHLFTVFTAHHHHQPKPPTEPFNHKAWVHVTSSHSPSLYLLTYLHS